MNVSARQLRPGTRVVAVIAVTDSTVEILGHGTYHQTLPSAEATQRLANALEAVEQRVDVDYQPLLDTLCQHMSDTRAHETRSRFHSRQHSHRSRPAIDRARDLASGMRGGQTIRLDTGDTIPVDRCWLVPADQFGIYAGTHTVKVVTSPR